MREKETRYAVRERSSVAQKMAKKFLKMYFFDRGQLHIDYVLDRSTPDDAANAFIDYIYDNDPKFIFIGKDTDEPTPEGYEVVRLVKDVVQKAYAASIDVFKRFINIP